MVSNNNKFLLTLWLAFFFGLVCVPTASFQLSKAPSWTISSKTAGAHRRWTFPSSRFLTSSGGRPFLRASRDVVANDDDDDTSSKTPSLPLNKFKAAVAGVSSVVCWCVVAYVALSHHPTPAVQASSGFRHNLLTIAQSLAFPVPILIAVCAALAVSSSTDSETSMLTTRRLSLGFAVASLWTAAAVFWGPAFATGYDLFSPAVRYTCSSVFALTAFGFALPLWKQAGGGTSVLRTVRGVVGSFFALLSSKPTTEEVDDDNDSNAALYSLGSLGLLFLAALPQLVGFPTATIPTLLGKRLSRAASGFTLLGGVTAYCLSREACERGQDNNSDHQQQQARILRRGLGIGAVAHLGLVAAKVAGVDGGGLILPGRGLWKDYPSLVASPGWATACMVVTYGVLALATASPEKKKKS